MAIPLKAWETMVHDYSTGAHVNNKRPTIKKLQFLVLLILFHSFHICVAVA